MRKTAVEWVVLVGSVLAVLAVTGVLLWETVRGETPADPSITLRESDAMTGSAGWLIPATVTNNGTDEAAGLTIEAAADVAGATETSLVTIDYLAGSSTVDVTFGFSERPAGPVRVRVVSFTQP